MKFSVSRQSQEKTLSTSYIDESSFTWEADVAIVDTAVKESQTQIVSLGHPQKETLEDFDNDLKVIAQDSLEHIDDQ